MKLLVFCGASGVGKTTLLEGVVQRLRRQGRRVGVIKHAHAGFDIDRPGKDSHRLREAGAAEVLLASDQRWVLLREHDVPGRPSLDALVALMQRCDWLLAEGFKQERTPKIEVWRAPLGVAPLYPHDADVIAVATDDPSRLPVSTALPVLPLGDPAAVADWLRDTGARLARSVGPDDTAP